MFQSSTSRCVVEHFASGRLRFEFGQAHNSGVDVSSTANHDRGLLLYSVAIVLARVRCLILERERRSLSWRK